ncbi:unnamed protein product [Caenorhabditis sp. 36 PRJEB53466]|nr:unnamed protein product [Caenorhabditis sp. 36 PRJEB53466]
MGSWNRRNQVNSKDNEEQYKDLLVFGYTSTIFPNDYQSESIAEERHMVPCLGDASNRVDRYDCRLLLPSIESALRRSGTPPEQCPTEAMEEDMCEEERYLDMHKDIQREKDEEDRRQKEQRNAIGFDYGTGTVKEESDSEDEPFEVPQGVKFPVGLELPPNMKLHHIIEKTASFVVANGAQMEIVIKAKQRNNAEQFGFLEFDNRLNPFYKYLQKLIREKKYVPDLTKRKKLSKTAPSTSNSKPVVSTSLAAIAAAHGSDSDDSDSDCELHPSLLSGGAKRPSSPEKPGIIGPSRKPVVEEKPPEMNTFGIMAQRNDVYAALFKNLAHVTREANGIEEEVKKEPEPGPEKLPNPPQQDPDGRLDDSDYREWYEMFYGRPCPWIGPRPMLPPTPDLEPILNSYAEHVAQKGADFEESLASRADLQLQFMDPKSPYYSYYHHKIRLHQWRMSQEYAAFQSPTVLGSPVPLMSDLVLPPPHSNISSPGPSHLLGINVSTPPEPPLNRRQRRRLLESSRVDETITEPGIYDPLGPSQILMSSSTPANLTSLENMKPISFSLRQEEAKVTDDSSFRFDPDLEDLEVPSTSADTSIGALFPPPTPPILPSSTQIDRKEKARIFMEKLLFEKKMRKQQEDEERIKLEEETRRKAEKISEELTERKSSREGEGGEKAPKSLDDIINNRINSLLSESGFHPIEEPKKEEEVKERKKPKKRSRSRRRSHSRGSRERDRSTDRKRPRKSERRNRSRSHSRDRHRRNRSRSRDRSYRR